MQTLKAHCCRMMWFWFAEGNWKHAVVQNSYSTTPFLSKVLGPRSKGSWKYMTNYEVGWSQVAFFLLLVLICLFCFARPSLKKYLAREVLCYEQVGDELVKVSDKPPMTWYVAIFDIKNSLSIERVIVIDCDRFAGNPGGICGEEWEAEVPCHHIVRHSWLGQLAWWRKICWCLQKAMSERNNCWRVFGVHQKQHVQLQRPCCLCFPWLPFYKHFQKPLWLQFLDLGHDCRGSREMLHARLQRSCWYWPRERHPGDKTQQKP